MLTRLSVKSKVVFIIVTTGLLVALIVGFLGWRSSRIALSRTVLAEMTVFRRSKAAQIEYLFRNMRYTAEVLSENDMVVEAMVRFNRAFQQLGNSTIPAEWDDALETYYTDQFFPRLFANLPGQADYNLYRPQNQAGLYLQYQYIVANKYESGQKLLLDNAEDGSEYSKVHAHYHPRLRSLAQKFGFYDLLLVNFETGDIVYTVSKETDFASNLDIGPYRRSNEATALEVVRNNTERGVAHLVDFELLRPSYGSPAAFWAAPIYNGNHLVGVLLAQVALEGVNLVITENQQWAQSGLGKTGEAYLVGSDGLMRSDARALIEDPDAYQKILADSGVSARTRDLIKNLDTTILLQEIKSPSVTAALQNQEGTEFTTNHLGRSVLASYQPLVLEGLQWAVVAEIAADEVFQPIYSFQRQFLISAVLTIVLLAFVALGVAYLLLRPLALLVEAAQATGDGADMDHMGEVAINIHTHDEWGELATTFNTMAQGIRQQAELLKSKEDEIMQLLRNALPAATAQRVRQGEMTIIDQSSQVTTFAIRIAGVSALAQTKSDQEVSEILQDMMDDVEAVAVRYDVEQLLSPGQQAFAVCGLSTPYLDHSRRMADFALALRGVVQLMNKRYNMQLTLHSGIHSGAFTGCVVRTPKIGYELWGESVTVAKRFSQEADPDTILVSQTIYDRLNDQYTFQRVRTEPTVQSADRRGQTPATTWVLVGPKQTGSA